MTPTCLVARAGPCDAESASTKRTITYAGKHSAQPSPVSRLDAQKGYAGTPTIGNARSLWFPFHSPGAMGRRVSVASSVDRQSKGAVKFRRTAGSGSLRNTASALVATSSAALSSRCDQCDYCRSLLPDEPARVRQISNLCAAVSIARSRPPACPQAPCPVRRAEGRGRRTGHPTASRSATL